MHRDPFQRLDDHRLEPQPSRHRQGVIPASGLAGQRLDGRTHRIEQRSLGAGGSSHPFGQLCMAGVGRLESTQPQGARRHRFVPELRINPAGRLLVEIGNMRTRNLTLGDHSSRRDRRGGGADSRIQRIPGTGQQPRLHQQDHPVEHHVGGTIRHQTVANPQTRFEVADIACDSAANELGPRGEVLASARGDDGVVIQHRPCNHRLALGKVLSSGQCGQRLEILVPSGPGQLAQRRAALEVGPFDPASRGRREGIVQPVRHFGGAARQLADREAPSHERVVHRHRHRGIQPYVRLGGRVVLREDTVGCQHGIDAMGAPLPCASRMCQQRQTPAWLVRAPLDGRTQVLGHRFDGRQGADDWDIAGSGEPRKPPVDMRISQQIQLASGERTTSGVQAKRLQQAIATWSAPTID